MEIKQPSLAPYSGICSPDPPGHSMPPTTTSLPNPAIREGKPILAIRMKVMCNREAAHVPEDSEPAPPPNLPLGPLHLQLLVLCSAEIPLTSDTAALSLSLGAVLVPPAGTDVTFSQHFASICCCAAFLDETHSDLSGTARGGLRAKDFAFYNRNAHCWAWCRVKRNHEGFIWLQGV